MEGNQYEWINKEYIGKYLKVNSEDVLKYEIKSAVGKGNNYASKLLRIEVELLENKNVNFLIKCLPDGVMKTLIQDVGMWDKEQYMYNKVLPLIEKSIGCNLSPECLNKDSEDDHINKEIILQDLNYLGYKMSDRTQQLDYDHCVIVMKTLAKFHAGSISVKKDHKKYIDHVGEELCFRETRRDRNEDYLKQPFECLSKELLLNNKNYNESELRRYRKGLKNIGDKFWDLIVNISKPKLNQFNVLNHGDLWTNNILFKYNEETGLVADARLIDFQCCRYTTPAFDLQYFFMSSCNEEVRKTRLQELVDVYINYLNKELNNLNLKIVLNDEELNRDLLMTDFYGLYTSIFVLPFSIRDSDNIEEVEDISEINDENSSGSNAFQNCIRGKKYQQLLPRLLSFYDKKGLFEDNYDVVDKFDVEITDNHVLN